MGAAGLKLPFLKPMCNLYSITTNQAAIIALFRVINRYVGNLPPMPGVFPDYPAPVIRDTGAGREMVTMRSGMPPPPRTPGPPRFPRELDHRDLVVQGGNQASCCWFVTKRPTFMKNLSQLIRLIKSTSSPRLSSLPSLLMWSRLPRHGTSGGSARC